MDLVSPRLPNLASKISGATKSGEDGALHVPSSIQPVVALGGPIRPGAVFTPSAVGVPGRLLEDSGWCNDSGSLAGPASLVNIAFRLRPGIWRLTIREEFLFTGASNLANLSGVAGRLDGDGSVPVFDINAHMLFVTHQAQANNVKQSVVTYELALMEILDVYIFVGAVAALVAGDLASWARTLSAQRIF